MIRGGAVHQLFAARRSRAPRRIPETPGKRQSGIEHHGRVFEISAFFVEDTYTIADIALYAYTHAAADGGFDLTRYPAKLSWLENVKALPRHVTIG